MRIQGAGSSGIIAGINAVVFGLLGPLKIGEGIAQPDGQAGGIERVGELCEFG